MIMILLNTELQQQHSLPNILLLCNSKYEINISLRKEQTLKMHVSAQSDHTIHPIVFLGFHRINENACGDEQSGED